MSRRTPIQESFEALQGMHCFACAPKRLNPAGLDLVFEETDDGAQVQFSLPAHFESYPGFLHGGILATILDETMAYAGVFKLHVLPFTRSLQLSFRKGVPAAAPSRCRASLSASQRLRFSAQGAVEDARGTALVTAKAEFVIPTLEMAEKFLGAHLERFKDFFR